MALDRMTDEEFANVVRVAGKSDLPPEARVLIAELFERVKTLEARSRPTEPAPALRAIVAGMNGDIEDLGDTPSNANLRDRMRSVLTAVRDLAEYLEGAQG